MKTLNQASEIVLRKPVRLRISRRDFALLSAHLTIDHSREQFTFALFKILDTPDCIILLVTVLLLPGPADMAKQTVSFVSPSAEYQSLVYAAAELRGEGILDIHTHTTDMGVTFSSTDLRMADRNRRAIRELLPALCTHAMVVFSSDLAHLDGQYTDRATGSSLPIHSIEVVGRPFKTLRQTRFHDAGLLNEAHARQVLIPGFNQGELEAQHVAVIGVGGNGAALVQTLACVGVGAAGSMTLVDLDKVEPSNLPRIPFSVPEDIGRDKVSVAAEYTRRKDPRITVRALPFRAQSAEVTSRIPGCTVLFGAGDNDGLRKLCNEWSIRFGVPYVDMGCDVQVMNDSLIAGGQVRVVIPGQTGCLVCTGGFDPVTAAIDLLDEAGIQRRAAAGYVVGAKMPTTPSIASLNMLTAQFAMVAFLSLLGSGPLVSWDYAHIDFLSGQIMTAMTQPCETCPVCGPEGVLFAGPAEGVQMSEPERAWSAICPVLVKESSA